MIRFLRKKVSGFFKILVLTGMSSGMSIAQEYYPIDHVQTEFLIDSNQITLVFLPKAESLFYCPGIVIEQLTDHMQVVKFVRLSIKEDIPDDVHLSESLRSWVKKHPDKTGLDGKLMKNPSALWVNLPVGTREVMFYAADRVIKYSLLPVENLESTD